MKAAKDTAMLQLTHGHVVSLQNEEA
jgi:hypothetical protein